MAQTLSNEQYDVLYTFRLALRQFLRWSEDESARVGLTSQQHQVLLAIRAHPAPEPPSIGDIANYLMTRHHSAAELVRRIESMGLLVRESDPNDRRVVRLQLTPQGEDILAQLTASHMAQLQRAASMLQISEPFLQRLSEQFMRVPPEHV